MATANEQMTSFERLSTALRMGIPNRAPVPDRVPVMLVAPLHGARELGLSPREYFSRAENVVEGQLRFVQRVGSDNVNAFFYFGSEAQAFGAEVDFRDDQSPIIGRHVISDPAQIESLEAPDPRRAPQLQELLRATALMAGRARGRWLVVGRVLGPFSLPIELMGLEAWFELLLFGDEVRRRHLLQITSRFFVSWAQALLAAGADVIAVVEPMASSTMLTRDQASKLVYPVLRQVVREIDGPTILWSLGAIGPMVDFVPDLGVHAVSADPTDDLREVKRRLGGRVALLGGLNDLAMLTAAPEQIEEEVRHALEAAAFGGGFVLSHQYEISPKVDYDTLAAAVEAARTWGKYSSDKGQIRAR